MAQTSATHQSIRRQSLDTQHRRRQRKCAWASSPHVRCAPPCQTCDGLAGDGGKGGGVGRPQFLPSSANRADRPPGGYIPAFAYRCGGGGLYESVATHRLCRRRRRRRRCLDQFPTCHLTLLVGKGRFICMRFTLLRATLHPITATSDDGHANPTQWRRQLHTHIGPSCKCTYRIDVFSLVRRAPVET